MTGFLTFGSLFSGIGGFDLGFERAGMECQWQVENDPWCREVLEKHWPKVPRYELVEHFPPNVTDDWSVDVLCGGFPCQPFSRQGRRRHKEDPRWLWPHFARLVRQIRPVVAAVENVPGLLDGGLDAVLGDLAALGYDAEWACLSASAFGAPQTRERVFVLAHADRQRWPADGILADGPPQAGGAQPPGPTGRWAGERKPCPKMPARIRWCPDRKLCRVAARLPDRLDRYRGLGNAIVPAVAEWIGHRIIAALSAT